MFLVSAVLSRPEDYNIYQIYVASAATLGSLPLRVRTSTSTASDDNSVGTIYADQEATFKKFERGVDNDGDWGQLEDGNWACMEITMGTERQKYMVPKLSDCGASFTCENSPACLKSCTPTCSVLIGDSNVCHEKCPDE